MIVQQVHVPWDLGSGIFPWHGQAVASRWPLGRDGLVL
jgi:hypothetical protein